MCSTNTSLRGTLRRGETAVPNVACAWKRGPSFWALLVLIVLFANVLVPSVYAEKVDAKTELVRVCHIVRDGETLDDVAITYLPPKLFSSERAFLEFREGIYELNYDRVFKDRPPYEVRKGDLLYVQFWAVVDYD